VDAVVTARIKRVVVGMVDPNPLVSANGLKQLKEANIEVIAGVEENSCRLLNRGFCKRVSLNQPWLTLKLATTLDGRIADRYSESRGISGDEAFQYVQRLRDVSDCVLVGGATVRADDALLNVRAFKTEKQPARIVLDAGLTLDPKLRIFQENTGGITYVYCLEKARAERGSIFPKTVKIIGIKAGLTNSNLNPHHLDLNEVMKNLASNGFNTVLCEGGGRLASALIKNDLIDEVHWIVAPKILGDVAAVASIAGTTAVPFKSLTQLTDVAIEILGDNALIRGFLPQAINRLL
jgi:diaminohydroxyphosphoribosylaminopyrimidine deaminase/5-amino-6-(5-phosphoribosylamino)uracil reductase